MKNPETGQVIKDTGGLRKMRFADNGVAKVSAAGFGLSITGGAPGTSSGFARCTTKMKWQI